MDIFITNIDNIDEKISVSRAFGRMYFCLSITMLLWLPVLSEHFGTELCIKMVYQILNTSVNVTQL